jgi:putative ABC transport system permease protein
MSTLTTKAIRDVTRRKLRTGLTVFGIAIGVTGLTAVNIASGQLRANLQSVNDSSGIPDIQFLTAPTDASAAQALTQQPNVKRAEAQIFIPGRWSIATGHEMLGIVGLRDFSDATFGKPSITEGRLSGPGEILMEASDRSVQAFKVGDSVDVQAAGVATTLKVSGLAHTAGLASPSFNHRATAYMRAADVQAAFHATGSNVFDVRLSDYSQRAGSAKQLAAALQAQNVVILQTVVGHDITGGNASFLDGIFTIMTVLSLIALVLSAFLLVSTISTLLAEQVPVIGTMKAIGARRGQVMRNYLTGVGIYGVAGTVLGFGLGVAAGALFVNMFGGLLGLDGGALAIPPLTVVEAIAVGIGVPILAALIPLWMGTRVTVKQALSGYGIENRARTGAWSRVAKRALAFMPQTVQLGARSVFRRRTRAVLTVLALALSGAAFLAVQTTSSSFNNVLDQVFSAYHADVFAILDNPQAADQVQAVVGGVQGVGQSEPSTGALATTRWGSAQIIGLQPDTALYRKTVLQGRWFTANDSSAVLINEAIADKTGLKVGDSIDFHNDLYQARWQVVGIARDYNNPLGLGVMLASQAEVNAFQHLPATYTSQLLVTSTSSRQADIDALSKRLDDALGKAGLQGTVITTHAQVQANQANFLIVYVLFYSVVAIIALVGAIGLFNALAMGVLERRREIGILRSMGATGGKVAQVFLAEGVGLGVVGWLLGIVVGIPAAYGFIGLLSSVLLRVPFAFNPVSLVVMLAFILIIAAAASLGPVWAASRVKIAQTLRYE